MTLKQGPSESIDCTYANYGLFMRPLYHLYMHACSWERSCTRSIVHHSAPLETESARLSLESELHYPRKI